LLAAEVGDGADHGNAESGVGGKGVLSGKVPTGCDVSSRGPDRQLLAGVLKLYRILAVSIIPIDGI
jgi:hypothetical protein